MMPLHKGFKTLSYINIIPIKEIWAYSSMDRIPGFGPVDLGSNPSRLITNIFNFIFLG